MEKIRKMAKKVKIEKAGFSVGKSTCSLDFTYETVRDMASQPGENLVDDKKFFNFCHRQIWPLYPTKIDKN